ncbi:MAG: hypothetical protein C0490_04885 [Marivirga sp.]|nr:hypothetical protein [Marivirga sp.]
MKKIMLILAGALCLSVAAVQAQDPQSETSKDSTSIRPSDPTTPAYRKDMVQIPVTEVPEPIKNTLNGAQLTGWEKGTFYSNADKSIFVLEIRDDAENRVRAYRFDPNGQPIKDN